MKIGVIGASGLVGRNIVNKLNTIKDATIICYASKNSNGKTINGHKIIELTDKSVEPLDYALFSAGGSVSKDFAFKFIKKGATVIDNSNAFRREEFVPLVVPEINFDEINLETKLISNPNCSTIQIALPLHVLNKLSNIKRVVISTYQSASGAGQKGLNDLDNLTTCKFNHVLNDDLIPEIDLALENGFTLEEDKVRFELRKILNIPKLKVNATCVRVPIHYCHGASVYVECEKQTDIVEFEKELKLTKGIKVLNNLKEHSYPLTKVAKGTDLVYVGRIRQDLDNKKAISFWVVADNTLKGAATNAVQILEKLILSRKQVND